MQTYIFEINNMIGPRWRHQTEFASDAMAKEWAMRTVATDSMFQNASLIVFGPEPDFKFVAEYGRAKPEAREIRRR